MLYGRDLEEELIIDKYLVDVTRRKILTLLRNGSMTAGEICSYFDSRPATISHHLSILKESNLVTAEKKAQVITYSLNVDVLQSMIKKLTAFINNRNV